MLNLDESSTSWKIIQIVSSECSLTSKEIYNRLKKKYNVSITYQAVYKDIQHLFGHSILIKEKMKYSINYRWVDNTKRELEIILKKRLDSYCTYSSKNLTVYHVNTLKELDNLIQKKVLYIAYENKIRKTYWKTPHCWWLLGYPLEEEEIIEKYNNMKIESFALITNNTRHDIDSIDYYKEKEPYSHIDIIDNRENQEVFQVIDDYIITCNIPKKIHDGMNKLYNQENPTIKDVLKLVTKKANYELQIIKNKTLAEKYIQEITTTTNHDS